MDPAIVKKLHDAFKKAYDDPKVAELYDKFDFTRRYMNTEDYAGLRAEARRRGEGSAGEARPGKEGVTVKGLPSRTRRRALS